MRARGNGWALHDRRPLKARATVAILLLASVALDNDPHVPGKPVSRAASFAAPGRSVVTRSPYLRHRCPSASPPRPPGALSPPEEMLRDHEPLDLARPFVDLQHLRVPHQLLHRVLLHVPVPPEHLHRV